MKRLLAWIFAMPCLFHQLTGLYCPGCGGTRAVKYLLHGQLLKSFQYHPLVLYALAVVILESGSWLAAKIRKKPQLYVGRETVFLYIALALVLVNWVVKNICLAVFGIDLLSQPLF